MGTLRKDKAFAKCVPIMENNSFCKIYTLLNLTDSFSASWESTVVQDEGRADFDLCDNKEKVLAVKKSCRQDGRLGVQTTSGR